MRHDITGQKFGKLTVLRVSGKIGYYTTWECQCECGNKVILKVSYLTSGDTKSCGCLKKQKCGFDKKRHGFTTIKNGKQEIAREYRSWATMIQRCTNPNHTFYKNYGGKGVNVCDEWRKFDNFIADMGKRPEGMSLDRIDPNGNYEPGNCRWADRMMQRHNRRIKPVQPAGAADKGATI